jgi:hypothetical protein
MAEQPSFLFNYQARATFFRSGLFYLFWNKFGGSNHDYHSINEKYLALSLKRL